MIPFSLRGSRGRLAAFTAAMIVFAAAGCSSPNGPAQPSTGGETLVVGTDATYPPYQYKEGGEYAGLEIDTARAIAKALGKNVDFVDVKYTAGIGALTAGRFDVFMAGGTIDSPGRRQQVLLIDEYDTSPGLIVPAGNPKRLGSQSSLCGRSVAVFAGAEFENSLKAISAQCGANPINILALSDANGPYDAVKFGRADAYFGNFIQATYQASKLGGEAVKVSDADGYLGAFMVKKGNLELAQELAAGLQKAVDSGEFAEIAAKYKVPASELVQQVTINAGEIPVGGGA